MEKSLVSDWLTDWLRLASNPPRKPTEWLEDVCLLSSDHEQSRAKWRDPVLLVLDTIFERRSYTAMLWVVEEWSRGDTDEIQQALSSSVHSYLLSGKFDIGIRNKPSTSSEHPQIPHRDHKESSDLKIWVAPRCSSTLAVKRSFNPGPIFEGEQRIPRIYHRLNQEGGSVQFLERPWDARDCWTCPIYIC